MTQVRTVRTGQFLGYGAVIVASCLWASAGIAGAVIHAQSELGWLTDSGVRLLLGGVLLLAFIGATAELASTSWTPPTLARVEWNGQYTASWSATYFLAPIPTVVTLRIAPATVASLGTLRDRSAESLTTGASLVVALGGLVLCSGLTSGSAVGSNIMLQGVLLSLVAGVAFGLATYSNRESVPGLRPTTLTAISFLVAGVPARPVTDASTALPAWDPSAQISADGYPTASRMRNTSIPDELRRHLPDWTWRASRG